MPIEQEVLNPEDRSQAQCIHLRALSHAFMQNVKWVEILNEELRLQSECNEPTINTSFLIKQLEEEQQRLSAFRDGLLNPVLESCVGIGYWWRTIPTALPVSNVSTFYPIPNNRQKSEFVRNPDSQFAIATFNLLPMGTHTEIVLTFNVEACPYLDYYKRDFFSHNYRRLARFVNRMTFNYSEDFCCRPSFWKSLKPPLKDKIQKHLCAIHGKEQLLPSLPIIPDRLFKEI